MPSDVPTEMHPHPRPPPEYRGRESVNRAIETLPMTAIPHPEAGDLAHAPAAHGHDAHAAHHEIGFVKRYIFSTDHKVIGLQFLFLGLAFMVIGGLEAMLIRWQLAW